MSDERKQRQIFEAANAVANTGAAWRHAKAQRSRAREEVKATGRELFGVTEQFPLGLVTEQPDALTQRAVVFAEVFMNEKHACERLVAAEAAVEQAKKEFDVAAMEYLKATRA